MLTAVVLAAGKGTRMKNALPKVLHPIAGKPMIGHALDMTAALGCERRIVVLGAGLERVRAALETLDPNAQIVEQDPPMGTGHAVMAAREALPESGEALVVTGDTPLARAETLAPLLEERRRADAAIAVLGMRPPDPTGYGRLKLDADGALEALIEHRDADEALRREAPCNSGIMAFDAARLPALLDAIEINPAKGEYYLTDAVAIAVSKGWRCVAVEGPWRDGLGVNSQAQLAEAEAIAQSRLRAAALDAGAIMPAPETVHLCWDTEIAPGALIEPHVVFGPGVRIEEEAQVRAFSHLEGARVARGAVIGPHARLRTGADIGENARIGNFVEVKNAHIEQGAKANHLAYLGDARLGAGANWGAGAITCNYDGARKHRTDVGSGAFVGTNASLVAPVRIGEKGFVAAGSVITKDVGSGDLAIGRARQTVLEGRSPAALERAAKATTASGTASAADRGAERARNGAKPEAGDHSPKDRLGDKAGDARDGDEFEAGARGGDRGDDEG